MVVIEKLDGAKYTYFVADLVAFAEGQSVPALDEEAEAATSKKPSNTRKR